MYNVATDEGSVGYDLQLGVLFPVVVLVNDMAAVKMNIKHWFDIFHHK